MCARRTVQWPLATISVSDMKPEFFSWISSVGRLSKPNPYLLGEREFGAWGSLMGFRLLMFSFTQQGKDEL